jgi:hypothetical protein
LIVGVAVGALVAVGGSGVAVGGGGVAVGGGGEGIVVGGVVGCAMARSVAIETGVAVAAGPPPHAASATVSMMSHNTEQRTYTRGRFIVAPPRPE